MKSFREFVEEQEQPDGDALEIVIESFREEGNPTSTVMKHRYKKNGKWTYDADLDSGEQAGAQEIPMKVMQLLKSFGHSV